MLNKWKKALKNEKGFTLVELLAVIVILGIIAAIAVPSIGNVIADSKKDAHIANAQSFAEAARLYEVTEDINTEETVVTIKELQDSEYISDTIESPDAAYDLTESTVNITEDGITVTLLDKDGNVILSGNPDEIKRDEVNNEETAS